MAACFRHIVNDVPAAIAFYTQHLSFKLEMHPAPPFAVISLGEWRGHFLLESLP